MILTVRESTLVPPAEPTPTNAVWLSNIDLITPNRYTLVGYFYRRPAAAATCKPDFFNPAVLREALSRALVPFYPIAGRLRHDKDGRLEIECNGEGALLVVAESTASFDDLGDFSPSSELRKLIPAVDYSANISSFPLVMFQITFFKCGGVSIGCGTHHRGVDGFGALDFIRTWCDIARGLDVGRIKPCLDRTVIRARDPPRPQFHHIEYETTKPSAAAGTEPISTTAATFNITQEQLNKLRHKFKDDGCNDRFSTYEVVSAHAWRCRCIASQLDGADQETRLLIATNGRQRFQPPLPEAYFGNVVFMAVPTATVNELVTEPTWYAARKIKEATKRMDDSYLRSAVDYLELLPPDKSAVARRPEMYKTPNLGITSWVRLPTEETDFGWGPPMFVGPLAVPYEGLAYLVRCPDTSDGSLSLAITLQTKHMKVFQEVFYNNL